MFNVSSSMGAELYKDHQLVTSGPFAYIRHPMYIGVLLAGWGALLLFRTWAMIPYALSTLAIPLRARREEEALAQAFGEAWQAYQDQVPSWIPSFK
jgi:protein-S-isoprenylcysteine O-methyltransferase Ste14